MQVLAIIPARGGSKGIPRKNLVEICSKPLVVHSIEHALAAEAVDRVIVSTEDEEIAETARRHGAEVPFMRPQALAEDEVLDHPVFEHVLAVLQQSEGYDPEVVVHLRPTTPYRSAGWIDEAIAQLVAHPEADSIRSVSPPHSHPYRVFRIAEDGYLDPLMKHEHPQPYLLRRQDLPPMYYYNCVIDVAYARTIREKGSMTGDRILPYIMDGDDAFDIDTHRDLMVARTLLEGQA